MKQDTYFLKKAISLAKKGDGFTSPNPLVGAVIVKSKKIIGCGFHRKAGMPHAEIEAIKSANKNIRGATLYVNLEPCCHFGKTPPCVDEIIAQGIKRVVIAIKDPNPLVNGKSIKKLKKNKIKVNVGLLKEEASCLNEVFLKNMKMKMPFVAAKVAQSLDGKIATRTGMSKWITSETSRKRAHTLRDKYDCVLIGVNTALKDNPRLNGTKKIPYKVIIDPNLRIHKDLYIVKNNPEKLIVFAAYKNKNKKFPEGIKVFFVKERNKKMPLGEILSILFKNGVKSIFIEGGSSTLGHFLDEKLIDKLYLFVAPKLIGGKCALTSIGAEGFKSLEGCPSLENMNIEKIDKDMLVTGNLKYANQ